MTLLHYAMWPLVFARVDRLINFLIRQMGGYIHKGFY
jgi:hypothetical protein